MFQYLVIMVFGLCEINVLLLLFGRTINNNKYIIKIITELLRAHQINMEVRKTPLVDEDGLGNQACVAVDLAPLAGQTPAGPGGDVARKTAPHKPK
jgi:hypothetical protein